MPEPVLAVPLSGVPPTTLLGSASPQAGRAVSTRAGILSFGSPPRPYGSTPTSGDWWPGESDRSLLPLIRMWLKAGALDGCVGVATMNAGIAVRRLATQA